jgi:hypothetical protein
MGTLVLISTGGVAQLVMKSKTLIALKQMRAGCRPLLESPE